MIHPVFNPPDKYVWDKWFVRDQHKIYHAFYQQADKTVPPEQRYHNKVSIGHATSHDLTNWADHPTALKPGKAGQWDDFALWSGSAFGWKDKWYMYYTGRSSSQPNKQQIGLAISDDLYKWQKHPKPIVPPNLEYYSHKLSQDRLHKPPAWRDPFVFKDPRSKWFYMTISAKSDDKKNVYNACIGLARSLDLIKWEVLPPILSPGLFDHMEVSQVLIEKDGYILLFSTNKNVTKPRAGIRPLNGLYGYRAAKIEGPFKPIGGKSGLIIDYGEEVYDLRVIEKLATGKYLTMGWVSHQGSKFIGGFSEPIEIQIAP